VQIVSPISLIQAVLIIAYPICCHFAVTLGEPQLQLLALLLLSLGLTFKGILQKSGFSLLVMAAITAISLAVYLLGQARARRTFPGTANIHSASDGRLELSLCRYDSFLCFAATRGFRGSMVIVYQLFELGGYWHRVYRRVHLSPVDFSVDRSTQLLAVPANSATR
jgi:hypothetical protein